MGRSVKQDRRQGFAMKRSAPERRIGQIKAATVDFGASDMPLRPEELARLDPLVIGGVVPVVNVDEVGPGGIRFSGPIWVSL